MHSPQDTLTMSTLIISPHIDDDVLGCASQLAPGTHVYYCGVETFREVSREARLAEAAAAAELMGHTFEVDLERVVNQYLEHELIGPLEALICSRAPRRVLIPHPGYNQDHRAVYNAAFIALRPHDRNPFVPQVLVYEGAHDVIWNPSELRVSFFVPLDVERKLAAYACHASQVRSMRSPQTLRAIAAVRGAAINVPYAEGFEILRWVDDHS